MLISMNLSSTFATARLSTIGERRMESMTTLRAPSQNIPGILRQAAPARPRRSRMPSHIYADDPSNLQQPQLQPQLQRPRNTPSPPSPSLADAAVASSSSSSSNNREQSNQPQQPQQPPSSGPAKPPVSRFAFVLGTEQGEEVPSWTWKGKDRFDQLDDRLDVPPLPLPALRTCSKRVVLVRHGQSTWNLRGRIQGSSDFSVLTDKGLAQAATARDLVSARARVCVRVNVHMCLGAHAQGCTHTSPLSPTCAPKHMCMFACCRLGDIGHNLCDQRAGRH
jgi:hypothetical protein